PREREPEYQGKTLSRWLMAYREPLTGRGAQSEAAAADAVRQIGTNGLPFLLKWIQDSGQLPRWRYRVYQIAYRWRVASRTRAFVLEAVAGRKLRAERAFCGFGILGPEAGAAIPALVKIASSQAEAGRSATRALGHLG